MSHRLTSHLACRTHFVHTCLCFRVIGHCNNIPLVAVPRRVASSLCIGHGSAGRYFSFVVSRLGTYTRKLPSSRSTRSLNHIAGNTTGTFLKHMFLFHTDPRFGPGGGGRR